MQNIVRLAGPVVHGFKRGSKLLGWWVCAACCLRRHLLPATLTRCLPPHRCFTFLTLQLSGPRLTWAFLTLNLKRLPQVREVVVCAYLLPSPCAGVYIGFATVAGQGPYKAAISVVRDCCGSVDVASSHCTSGLEPFFQERKEDN
jgi:hypothetical protein